MSLSRPIARHALSLAVLVIARARLSLGGYDFPSYRVHKLALDLKVRNGQEG